jgi:hypothetical protein
MRDIYASAEKVLVLDAVLSQVSKFANSVEILTSIRSSTWVRRLWTFHEAALATQIYYQFANHAMKSTEIYQASTEEELDQAIKFFHRKSWSLSSFDVEVNIDKGMREQYNIALRLPERLVHLQQLKSQAFQYLAVVEAHTIDQHDRNNYRLLSQATRPLRWRRTSRIEDETICIAGVLGVNVAGLINESHLDRMKKLLGEMEYVPADILFLDKPRIQDIGYRWMPTTFLGMGNDPGMSFAKAAKPTGEGLLVDLPGIVIHEPFMPLDLRSSGYVREKPIYTQQDRRVYSIVPLDSNFTWERYHGVKIIVIWSTETTLNTIKTGQLVQVDKEVNGRIHCHLECQVIISSWNIEDLEGNFPKTLEFLKLTQSEQLPYTQRWCVG